MDFSVFTINQWILNISVMIIFLCVFIYYTKSNILTKIQEDMSDVNSDSYLFFPFHLIFYITSVCVIFFLPLTIIGKIIGILPLN